MSDQARKVAPGQEPAPAEDTGKKPQRHQESLTKRFGPGWSPGNPGNSGGKRGRSGRRPRTLAIRCQAMLSRAGTWKRLEQILAKGEDRDALRVITFLAERAEGLPRQRHEFDGAQPTLLVLFRHE